MVERDEYNKIFDNGIDHINASKLLADNGFFGFAISHIILGVEELIKYQVVRYHISNDKLFDGKEIESVFKYHNKKHDLIKEFQEAISKQFSTDFLDYILQHATEQRFDEKHLKIEKNRFKEIGSFLSESYKEINIPEEERNAFFEWLRNANTLKNNGFYVNRNEKESWTPKNLTKVDFETAFKYADAIRKQIEVSKSLDLTEEEFKDFLNSDVQNL